MKSIIGAATAALTLIGTLANAQTNPIAARQTLMKDNQAALDRMFAMVDGRIPYNATEVRAALNKFVTDYAMLPTLFPDGSNVSPSSSRPAAFTNKAALATAATKLSNDAKAAAEAATTLASLTNSGLLDVVARDCSACHFQFRAMGPGPGGPPRP